jgi:hypothetical protein
VKEVTQAEGAREKAARIPSEVLDVVSALP